MKPVGDPDLWHQLRTADAAVRTQRQAGFAGRYRTASRSWPQDYLDARKKAALAGQVYQPILGFATTNNIKGRKYPYDTFYGGITPRVSVAWNPKFSGGLLGKLLGENKTVIRGGYGRIYGRLNGVNLLLVPLLPPGLLQAVSCVGVSRTGGCLGANGVDPEHRVPHRHRRQQCSAAAGFADPAAALSSRASTATPARATSTGSTPSIVPNAPTTSP